MPSTPGRRTCSPSPSTISSCLTPTKVLAEKLDSLHQKWSVQVANSPIQIMNPRKRHDIKRRPGKASGNRARNNNNNNGSRKFNNKNRKKPPAQVHHPVGADDDDFSIGNSSVSTLGSTESVFDRLYRQRKPTSKARQEGNSYQNDRTSCSSGSIGDRGGFDFASPVPRTLKSIGSKNRKNRLGAYSNSSVDGSKSVGYKDTTPQRWSSRKSSHSMSNNANRRQRNDGSSIASKHSAGNGFDVDDANSVFARLYRNEKRTEKLWKKPREFTPTLSAASKRKNQRKGIDKPGDEIGQKELFPNVQKNSKENENENENENEKKMYHQTRTYEDDGTPTVKKSTDIKITPMSEDDFEVIDKLGKHLESIYDGCSPTVAATSVSSWDDSPENRNHSDDHQHSALVKTPKNPADEGRGAIEAAGKQPEQMDADQQSFLGYVSDTSCHSSINLNQERATRMITESNSPIDDYPRIIPCTKTGPNKEEYNAKKDRAILPSPNNDRETSKTNPTDNFGFFSLDQSIRSFSSDDHFVHRIDRLPSPISRRDPENLVSNNYHELEPVFNPQQLRGGSAVIIQRAYRLHRAELQVASAMIQSWSANVQFLQGNKNQTLSSIRRHRAFQRAIRAVKCWWILEGLHIEGSWISLAWENEVCIEDGISVQVNLTCEAKSLRITSRHWEPTKVAVLLAKVGLLKAIQREQASEEVALYRNGIENKLHQNATIIQDWFRRRSHARGVRNVNVERIDKNTLPCPVNNDDEDQYISLVCNHRSHDLTIPPSLKGGFVNNDVKDPSISPSCDDRCSMEQHAAATKIQNFLRLTILRSAIKEWPSTINKLQTALDSAEPSPNQQQLFDAARNILRSSMIGQQTSVNKVPLAREIHRKISSKNDFISQRAATLAIQNIVRIHVAGLKKYSEKKKATLIQAIFRGYRTRKRLDLEDLSAVVIQFAWSERRYVRIKAKNATKIQTHLRMLFCQRDYEMQRFCITFIQAGWRRAVVRRRLASLKSSTLLVQCIWRSFQDRKIYLNLLSAIRSIQYLCKIKNTITAYENDCYTATMIQSWWRMHSSRILFLRSLNAGTCVQAHVRRIIQCRKFQKAQFDCLVIQRTWRAYRCTKHYESQKRAAVCLQAFFRARLSINAVNKRRRNIIDIQRVFRGFFCRFSFALSILSATKLQKHWRRHRELGFYLNYVKAAITLQSYVRNVIQRKKYLSHYQAILDIQRVTRGSLCRDRILTYKEETRNQLVVKKSNGAIILQKIWRASVERERYTVARKSTILLQKVTRRILTQSLYEKKIRSGRTIQSWLKLLLVRHKMRKSTISSIMIQSIWRGARAHTAFNEIRNATISIQSSYRTRSAIKVFRCLIQYRAMEESSILIQSQWRGAMARENYILCRISVVMIQALFRRILTCKRTKISMNQEAVERASTLIQSYWRRAKACEGYEKSRISAITIQSFVRRRLMSKFTQELRNERLLRSSVLIQTHWRGTMARENFTTARGSAIIIQACARRIVPSRFKEALLYKNRAHKSSILIQSKWRGASARLHFNKSRSCALMIQSALRRMSAKKRARSLKRIIRCSLLIQSCWRTAIARDRYSEVRVAATMIQSSARGMSTRRRFDQITKSSVLIQRAYRAHIARNAFHRFHTAVILIQYRFRSYRMKLYKLDAISSVLSIQALYRRTLAQSNFNSYKASVILTQRTLRGYLVRVRLRRRHVSATIIQRKWKLCRRVRHVKAMAMSTLIQSFWRSSIDRGEYMQYRAAIMIIQATIRGAFARSQFQNYLASVICIQSRIRGYLCRKNSIETKSRLKKITEISTFIQSHWRASLARGNYLQHRSATMIIQSMFRGAFVRSRWRFVRLLSRKKRILNRSARKIQIAYIAWRMDIAVWEMRSSTVLLQRGVRGHLARSVVQYALMHMNASRNSTIVESRGRLVINQDYEQGVSRMSSWNTALSEGRTSAAIIIQSAARRFVARKLINDIFGISFDRRLAFSMSTMRSHNAVIVIQRSFIAWSQFRNYSAIKIQKTIRGWITWKIFRAKIALITLESKVEAAIKIQIFFRCQTQKFYFFVQKQAIVKIQSSWRKILAQVAFADMITTRNRTVKTKAVTKIQAFQRCQKQRLDYFHKKRILIRIQNLWRSVLARNVFMRSKTAASLIQLKFRDYQRRKREEFLISRVVLIQSLVRRVIVQRGILKRRQESHRQMVFASNQALSEARAASVLLVDNLLAKRESVTNQLFPERLEARVQSTLNEAESLSNEEIRYIFHRGPLLIPLPPTLQDPNPPSSLCTKSTNRVKPISDEAESLSNEDIRDLVHRGPLVIPLPPSVQNSNSHTSLSFRSADRSTPVNSNISFQFPDTPKTKNRYIESKALPSRAKASATESRRKILNETNQTVLAALETRDHLIDRKKSDVILLAKQATDLMQEGRAKMKKNRKDGYFLRNKKSVVTTAPRSLKILPSEVRETFEKVHECEPVANNIKLENFGDAKMPSPIRPQEQTSDWDWTAEW